MFMSLDFMRETPLIEKLGEGTFGTVGLHQTCYGHRVIKATKISDESLGYPHDFINEVDMLMKLRDISSVVALKGVFFEDKKRKGYIHLEPMDTNLSKWSRRVPFSVRITHLMTLISSIGGTLAIMHHYGLIHNDIKANNILLSNTSSGPIFKLADFGKAKCIISSSGSYGCIDRYKAPFDLNLYKAEFWAFMITLVEVIIGERLLDRTSVTEFYQDNLKIKGTGIKFDLRGFLSKKLRKNEFQMIPQFFWDFVDPLISNQITDITSSLQRIGINITDSCLAEVGKNISRSGLVHPSFKKIEREFKKRINDMDMSKHYYRFHNLINKFLYSVGIEFDDLTLRQYAEVALTMVIKRNVDYLRYFQDQKLFLVYQRAFLITMGHQVHVL